MLLGAGRVALVVVADGLGEERREGRVVRGRHGVAAHAGVGVVEARLDALVEGLLVLIAQAVVVGLVEVPALYRGVSTRRGGSGGGSNARRGGVVGHRRGGVVHHISACHDRRRASGRSQALPIVAGQPAAVGAQRRPTVRQRRRTNRCAPGAGRGAPPQLHCPTDAALITLRRDCPGWTRAGPRPASQALRRWEPWCRKLRRKLGLRKFFGGDGSRWGSQAQVAPQRSHVRTNIRSRRPGETSPGSRSGGPRATSSPVHRARAAVLSSLPPGRLLSRTTTRPPPMNRPTSTD